MIVKDKAHKGDAGLQLEAHSKLRTEKEVLTPNPETLLFPTCAALGDREGLSPEAPSLRPKIQKP